MQGLTQVSLDSSSTCNPSPTKLFKCVGQELFPVLLQKSFLPTHSQWNSLKQSRNAETGIPSGSAGDIVWVLWRSLQTDSLPALHPPAGLAALQDQSELQTGPAGEESLPSSQHGEAGQDLLGQGRSAQTFHTEDTTGGGSCYRSWPGRYRQQVGADWTRDREDLWLVIKTKWYQQ